MIAVDAHDPDLATVSGTVWNTGDRGTTWSEVMVAPGTSFDSLSVLSTGEAWAGSSCLLEAKPCDPRGVWRSVDRGLTWRRISTTPVVSLTFGDKLHGWGATDGATGGVDKIGLLSTADGGETWRLHPSPCVTGSGWPVAVSFPDAVHGWIGCDLGGAGGTAPKAVMATVDGGATWSVRSSVLLPRDGPSVGSISFSDSLVGVQMRADGSGMTWSGRGSTARTLDGGRTWTEIPLGSFDERLPSAASLVDEHHWFGIVCCDAAGQGRIEASSDAGLTWTKVSDIPSVP